MSRQAELNVRKGVAKTLTDIMGRPEFREELKRIGDVDGYRQRLDDLSPIEVSQIGDGEISLALHFPRKTMYVAIKLSVPF